MKPVSGEDQLQRRASQWAKECEMMLTLTHPNIVRAFAVPDDIVQIAASPFSLLAMEYCPDGDLRKVLSHISLPHECTKLQWFLQAKCLLAIASKKNIKAPKVT